MGLLERAIASNANSTLGGTSRSGVSKSDSGGVETLIADFSRKNPSFYCLVLHADNGTGQKLANDISGMIDGYGAACADLSGGKCLALLPGSLDGELFAHRLSRSSGSAVLFQSAANSSSLAIEMLSLYIRE